APPCSATLATDLALAVGAYTAIDPAADSGCVSFPANASSNSAEYVAVAQSAGGVPGDTAPFALQSASLVAGAAPVTARRAALLGRRGSIAARTFPARDRPDQRGPTLRRGHRGRGRDTPHAGQPPHLHGVRQPRLHYLQAGDRASPIGGRARRHLRGHGGARERAHRDRYRHAPAGVRHA